MDKVCTIREAVGSIRDGDMVALGGNTLNRSPMEAVLELIRLRKRRLRKRSLPGYARTWARPPWPRHPRSSSPA